MEISDYFRKGDVRGAMEYMRGRPEYAEYLPAYEELFADGRYRTYDVPDRINTILLAYQQYFREVFYCGIPEAEAEEGLFGRLREIVSAPDADEDVLSEKLTAEIEGCGYHVLFGKTQGYRGPYLWKETEPKTFPVEIPGGTAEYAVNILRGFVFRSWMDYLTFGWFGTGGWTSPDGTINCIEQAWDFDSERFRVSLLKHEAQHADDMKKYPDLTSAELEYRAKLAELCFSDDPGLLQRFFSQADENAPEDGHAAAAARIRKDFAGIASDSAEEIRKRARVLFAEDTEKRDSQKGECNP